MTEVKSSKVKTYQKNISILF